ncbi:hypothetical protein QR680_010492 [Steinernema hermaphroditum]|uniref:Uncharacterized protein n=1 Tax=Steinernema hermaphroditum TaxID=289476 RepID=A0AA39IQP7_9BILA|nr:hypothetical protein QR680_010492 [Steinernema hermaphroditum]
MLDHTGCSNFYTRASLAGVTPLRGRDGNPIGDVLCRKTGFKVPSYKECFLPVASSDDKFYITNLLIEGGNAFYAVSADADLGEIRDKIHRMKHKCKRIFNIGTSQGVLVYDEMNELHRGVVFERLEKVRVYLIDSGRTIDVPYGEVLAIPNRNWIRAIGPCAFRFFVDGLPEDFAMTEDEKNNLNDYIRSKTVYIKILSTKDDEDAGFIVSLHKEGEDQDEDIGKLLLEGKFKEEKRRFTYTAFEIASDGQPITCHYCKTEGHRMEKCWQRKMDMLDLPRHPVVYGSRKFKH